MLNPMLPDEIASKEIPTQSFAGVKELFAFRKVRVAHNTNKNRAGDGCRDPKNKR